jgi:hypothetical protein
VYGPYVYKVTVFNEISERTEKVAGVTFASKFSEAVHKLENYYGNTLIDIHIDELEEAEVLEFPVETAEGIVNGTL